MLDFKSGSILQMCCTKIWKDKPLNLHNIRGICAHSEVSICLYLIKLLGQLRDATTICNTIIYLSRENSVLVVWYKCVSSRYKRPVLDDCGRKPPHMQEHPVYMCLVRYPVKVAIMLEDIHPFRFFSVKRKIYFHCTNNYSDVFKLSYLLTAVDNTNITKAKRNCFAKQ